MDPAQQPMSTSQNYVMPAQMQELASSMASLTRILTEIPNTLISLRREFRGEALYQDDDGGSHWVQVSKPVFIQMDQLNQKPLKKTITFPWGETREVFIPNDEAIDEILSMLKFVGINQISPIGVNTEDNYLDDLREFECKLAGVLALKQKEWGLDKELLPMLQMKIKTLVQDVRSMSVKGNTIKALQTTVQRVEQMIEGDQTKKRIGTSPYG